MHIRGVKISVAMATNIFTVKILVAMTTSQRLCVLRLIIFIKHIVQKYFNCESPPIVTRSINNKNKILLKIIWHLLPPWHAAD
jgi:hypothetical protein